MNTPRIKPGGVREIGVINTVFARIAGRVTGTGRRTSSPRSGGTRGCSAPGCASPGA